MKKIEFVLMDSDEKKKKVTKSSGERPEDFLMEKFLENIKC